MKHNYPIIIPLLIICCVLVSCEKVTPKEEPSNPNENLTNPNSPTEDPSNTVPTKVYPTAYFTFDGTLDDISGNDYYGYGAPEPLFVEGMISGTKALSFTKTGKQAFVIGDGIIDTHSMTVSFWAKDISEGDIFYLTSSNVDYGNKMMSLTFRDGHLKYVVKRNNNYYSNSYNSTGNFSHKPINDGMWHHIALVSDYYSLSYGNVTTSLYVDGTIMDTVTEAINMFDEKESNHCHYETGTKFVLGGENVPMMKIACLRMYADNQLNDNQIKSIYNNELNGIIEKGESIKKPTSTVDIKSGLSAFFSFDGVFHDLSGNDHFGYGIPVPSFTGGLTSDKKALSFTKTGKEAFIIGEGIIDTRSMTVCFWVKNISEGDIFYLTSTNKDYGEKMMSLTYRDGHLKYVVKRNNNYYTNQFNALGNFTHKAIDDGKWHHIALISDYNNLAYALSTTSLYIDGRIMDTVTENINPFDENESNHCHYGSGSKFILGGNNVPTMQVACLRMYDSVQLNGEQIMKIYENELNGIIEKPNHVNNPVKSININSGLTAYFPFDGNLNDVSGNDYYGYGNPEPSYTTGLTSSSKALSFTKAGEESFVIGNGLIDTKSMTISFWLKDISDGNIFYVTSSSKGNGGEEMMTLKCKDGFLKYIVCRYYNHYNSDASRCFIHRDICDGEWHHIALTSNYGQNGISVSTTKLYVDGRIMDTVTESFSEGAYDNRHFGTGTKFILGGKDVPTMKVAHLRVYDSRELNDNEIMSLYKDKH